MAGNKKEYKKKNSTYTIQHPENTIETYNRYGLLTNETNLNYAEGNPNTEPQNSTYFYTWCNQLWRNDQPNKKHSRR
jgi:hypothetical protein